MSAPFLYAGNSSFGDEAAVPPHIRSRVTGTPADLGDAAAQAIHRSVRHFADEAVYVYSFTRQRLLYADGFPAVLGFADDEISLLRITALTVPCFMPFVAELTDKAFSFMQAGHPHIEQYSFTMELRKFHRQGSEVPVTVRVGVFETENGHVTAIVGRIQLAPHLLFGRTMHYSVYGPEKNLFEEALSRSLFAQPAISAKEREALVLVATGAAFKEIAGRLHISRSAVEKRILPLYKRFGVSSLPHLVSYAYDNGILP